jgi:hypothetical protein
MSDESIRDYIFTEHALFEMKRRSISPDLVRQIPANPEQRAIVRQGRVVFQSKTLVEGKSYLVRVLVDIDRQPCEVVTVYRTSKIEKYWGGDT